MTIDMIFTNKTTIPEGGVKQLPFHDTHEHMLFISVHV